MCLFGVANQWGAKRPSLLKVCHTYNTMMKLGQLYLTQVRSKGYKNHVTQSLSSAGVSIFSAEIEIYIAL